MKSLLIIGSLAIGLYLSACNPANTGENGTDDRVFSKGQSAVLEEGQQNTILGIAINSPDHSTLVAAVQAAELEDVLVNAGPLTVFAPTNAAFDKLPEGTLEELIKPENKATLARIIKHHAAPGNYKGNMLKDGLNLYMATGFYLKMGVTGEQVNIEGANILGSVDASNGVVHVIDEVLLPPEN